MKKKKKWGKKTWPDIFANALNEGRKKHIDQNQISMWTLVIYCSEFYELGSGLHLVSRKYFLEKKNSDQNFPKV